MAIFPLQEAQNNNSLIRHSCNLYRLSLLRVLPMSLGLVAIYHLFLFGGNYIPANYQAKGQQLMMFIALLSLPLFSMMISMMLQIGEQKAPSYRKAIKISLIKFLSLVGCLLSMILFPAIVLAIGVILYLLVGHYFPSLPVIVFPILKILIGVAVFLASVPKIIAPILLFSENKDANAAIEASEQATKMAYSRTLLWSLYGFSLLGFVAILPSIFNLKFMEWIKEALLVLLLPWVVALLVMQAKDLYFRLEKKKKSEETPSIKLNANASLDKDNNTSF